MESLTLMVVDMAIPCIQKALSILTAWWRADMFIYNIVSLKFLSLG
ncbi:hypothetical protein LINPERHAP1_LOCUS27705 [Linum perenne]